MKNMGILLAALVVCACLAASASAGEISKSTLSSMGLSSMETLSANDGLAVRGKGTHAAAWGQSTANFYGGQTSTNGYDAGASHRHGSSTAVGANVSVAGVATNRGFIIVGAGGGSFGYAK
jgi:hypothetical protein